MAIIDIAVREKMTLKVSSLSEPHKVATSIIKNMQEGKIVETISIGAGAINQSMKAIIIARGIMAQQGTDLTIRPGFQDVSISSETKTAIKMLVIRS